MNTQDLRSADNSRIFSLVTMSYEEAAERLADAALWASDDDIIHAAIAGVAMLRTRNPQHAIAVCRTYGSSIGFAHNIASSIETLLAASSRA